MQESKLHFGPVKDLNYSHFIVDKNIFNLYKDHFKDHLVYITPSGESCKNFREVEKCLNFFLENGINRKSHLVIVGGGATSDFGGFVASILLRGIKWSVIPTTLLSMVDSSIGGKTGVNSPQGKNLIGSFHLPENVWIDVDFLKTLPHSEMESGKGEILKYCFLNQDTFDLVNENSDMREIIKSCINYKNKVVKNDFKEACERKFLNLGHTIGHALELNYGITHGEAVRWGIYLVLDLLGKEDLLEYFSSLNQKLFDSSQRPSWLENIDAKSLIDFIKLDKKKVSADLVELVGIERIGKPILIPKAFSDIQSYLEK